jgi:protein TonB
MMDFFAKTDEERSLGEGDSVPDFDLSETVLGSDDSQGTLPDDLDDISRDADEGSALPELRRQSSDWEQYLKYGIVFSCILHFAVFVVLPAVAKWPASRSSLRPGEKVTQVRLLEFPTPQEKPEPPPDAASAFSDRNHIAQREQIPLAKPGPRPFAGKIAPPGPTIAALQPPMAPEELEKPQQEHADPQTRQEEPREKPEPDPVETAEQPKERRAKGKRPTSPAEKKPSRRSSVDLQPTQQEVARALSGVAGSSDLYLDGAQEEVVVDLNTRDHRFFSYMLHLKRKIESVWVYPRSAEQNGIGGQLTVEFVIAKDGKLIGSTLIDSSGHNILDQAVMTALQSAAPYHPFPPGWGLKRLKIPARFIYVNERYFRRIM